MLPWFLVNGLDLLLFCLFLLMRVLTFLLQIELLLSLLELACKTDKGDSPSKWELHYVEKMGSLSTTLQALITSARSLSSQNPRAQAARMASSMASSLDISALRSRLGSVYALFLHTYYQRLYGYDKVIDLRSVSGAKLPGYRTRMAPLHKYLLDRGLLQLEGITTHSGKGNRSSQVAAANHGGPLGAEVVRCHLRVLEHDDLRSQAFQEEHHLQEGFNILILMRVLADLCPSVEDQLSRNAMRQDQTPEDLAAFDFFSANLAKVEVLRFGSLETMYFPRPLVANYLTTRTREQIVWDLSALRTPEEKVNALMEGFDDCLEEMRHQGRIHRHQVVRKVFSKMSTLQNLGFFLVILINLLLLLSVNLTVRSSSASGEETSNAAEGHDSLLESFGMSTVTEFMDEALETVGMTTNSVWTTLGNVLSKLPHSEAMLQLKFDMRFSHWGAALAVSWLGALHLFLSVIIMMQYAVNFGWLMVTRKWKVWTSRLSQAPASNLPLTIVSHLCNLLSSLNAVNR